MAGSAVVGNLRVVFSADTAEFSAKANEVTKQVKDIGATLKDELEPRQRAVNAAMRDFLGANEIRKAQEYVQAIEKIGGITQLTEADQKKVNRALTEALDHYRLLGKDAPKAMVDIEAATRKVEPPIKAAGVSLEQIWSGLKSAAGLIGIAFSVGAVVNFAKSVFDAASNIHDMSAALGFGAEAYQRMTFAAEQSGGSVEAFTRAAQKLNDNLGEGSKSTVAALTAAGLSFEKIRNLKPEQAFLAVADAVGKIADPMTRAQVAQDLFGKGALVLLPGMIEGYQKLGAAATVMSDDTINRLEAAQDAWDALGKKITIITGEMIGQISRDVPAAFSGWTKLFGDMAATAQFGLQGHLNFVDGLRAASTKAHGDINLANEKAVDSTKKLSAEEEAAAKKAEAAAEAHNKAIQSILDSLTKADVQRKINDLTEAYNRLTPRQRENADIMARVTEEAVKLERAGGKLSGTFKALADTAGFFNEMAGQTRRSLLALNAPNALPAVIANYERLDAAYVQSAHDFIGSVTNIDVAAESIQTSYLKLKPPPDVWKEFKDDAKKAAKEVELAVSDHLTAMLLRTESFRDGWKAIWNDLKNYVGRILSDILNEFETRFIKGLINSILGGKGGMVAAFGDVFGAAAHAGMSTATGVIDSRVPELTASGAGAGAAWGSAFYSGATIGLFALGTYLAFQYGEQVIKPALKASLGGIAGFVGDLIFGGGDHGTGPQTPIVDPNTGQVIYDPNQPNNPSPGFDPGNPGAGNPNWGGEWGGVASMAAGGIVYPRPGGTIVRVAEAGYPEMITPVRTGGDMMTAIFEIDGRQFARATFPYTAGEATRLGLTRV